MGIVKQECVFTANYCMFKFPFFRSCCPSTTANQHCGGLMYRVTLMICLQVFMCTSHICFPNSNYYLLLFMKVQMYVASFSYVLLHLYIFQSLHGWSYTSGQHTYICMQTKFGKLTIMANLVFQKILILKVVWHETMQPKPESVAYVAYVL